MYLAAEPKVWEFDSPLCLQGEERTHVVLGKLNIPKLAPEEGNGKPHLYLENPGKGQLKS